MVAHHVERPAAPLTTYLVGYAAGQRDADPAEIEKLAARAQLLAEGWTGPATPGRRRRRRLPDDSRSTTRGDRFED